MLWQAPQAFTSSSVQMSWAGDKYELKVNNIGLGPLHNRTIKISVTTHLGVYLLVRSAEHPLHSMYKVCSSEDFHKPMHVLTLLLASQDAYSGCNVRLHATRGKPWWMLAPCQRQCTANTRACARAVDR